MISENHTIQSWNEIGLPEPRRGIETRHICPFCAHNRKPEHQREKDFAISANGEVGVCHHCGSTVNINTRSAPMPNAPSAMVYLPQDEPKPPPSTPDTLEASRDAWEPLLASRAIDIEMLEQDYGVRFIWTHDMGHTMVIPQYDPDTGELVNHKYRGIQKQFRNDKGTRRPMYNLSKVLGADEIIIVEGEMDVFALDTAGFPHVVSVPDGAPSPGTRDYSKALAFMEQAIPHLLNASKIVIMTDNDEPGDLLRKELENRIGVGVVSHVRFPEGISDANDAILKLGTPWIRNELHKAVPAPRSGVYTPEDSWPDIEHAIKYGFDTGTAIGFNELDKIYRPTLGHLTIITGHAGSGKSTVLDNFILKLRARRNWAVAYFSPEQMPISRHLLSLAEIWIGKPTVQSRARAFNTEVATPEEIRHAIDFLQPYISHISPEMADELPSLDTILEMATAEVRRIGIKGLVLDPWNEIESARPNNVTETEWVSIALGKIRRWARKHNVHVWLIAHPRKMREENGKDAVPGLGDISGSNNFRNKADYGLTISNANPDFVLPGQMGACKVWVTKSRWRDSAIVNGTAYFQYNPANNRLESMPPTYAQQVQSTMDM